MMVYSVDQIEKHTIVMRLAVSIYKMNEAELTMLLETLVDNGDDPGTAVSDLPLKAASGMEDDSVRRQMLIAKIFVLIQQLDKNNLLDRLAQLKDPAYQWVREYPRLSCLMIIDFAAQGKAYRSCIRDISAKGMFIETSENFEPGQELALCFTLSEANESMPFKVKGRVTRSYPGGIGVQYEKITHYQREIINTLINKIS
jgi:Tfp pilus assembly protein PilZ